MLEKDSDPGGAEKNRDAGWGANGTESEKSENGREVGRPGNPESCDAGFPENACDELEMGGDA